jgi:hypothetical protein
MEVWSGVRGSILGAQQQAQLVRTFAEDQTDLLHAATQVDVLAQLQQVMRDVATADSVTAPSALQVSSLCSDVVAVANSMLESELEMLSRDAVVSSSRQLLDATAAAVGATSSLLPDIMTTLWGVAQLLRGTVEGVTGEAPYEVEVRLGGASRVHVCGMWHDVCAWCWCVTAVVHGAFVLQRGRGRWY